MSPDQEAINAQLELPAAHRRTLAIYLRQQAQFGLLAPLAVFNGIAVAQNAIRRIKEQLRSDGVPVEDEPNLAAVMELSSSSVQTIISEIGTDMRRFPTVKRFAAGSDWRHGTTSQVARCCARGHGRSPIGRHRRSGQPPRRCSVQTQRSARTIGRCGRERGQNKQPWPQPTRSRASCTTC
jgi:hypothetical protein